MNPPPLPPAAQAALERGRAIEAIRIVRQHEGIGLKEAKARVDAHRRRPGKTPVGLAGPAERPGAGLLVVAAVLVLLLAWYVIAT
jgi:hypothetical protein